jgi:fibronectin-binding autotransporter adhesin
MRAPTGLGRACLVVVVSLAVATVGTPALAAITVNCPGQSLQAKINSAPAGSTLLVHGTCVGNFVLKKNLTLAGNPTATLDGDQAGTTLRIVATPTVHLSHLTVTDGLAPNGGGILADGGKLFLAHVTVAGNYAIGTSSVAGGGILFGTGTLALTASTITHDVAYAASSGYASAGGGGIAMGKGTLSITGSSLRRNSVVATSDTNDSGAVGGAIDVTSGATTHIASSHIDQNRSLATGFDNPLAEAAGMNLDAMSLSHSTVNGNVAQATSTGSGGQGTAAGAAFFAGSLSTPTPVSFTQVNQNRAIARGLHGGASAAVGGLEVLGHLELTRSSVSSNVVSATGTTFASGTAGGTQEVGDVLTITRSTVAANVVTVHSGSGPANAQAGGVTAGGAATITQSTVRDNHVIASSGSADAQATGGGLVAPPQSFTLRASTVSGNTADATAKGTHNASADAGGIYLFSNANDHIVNSTIEGNAVNAHAASSSAAGGGIESLAKTLTVTDSTIARNQAGERGGGLLVIGTAKATLLATILAGNSAPPGAGPDCRGTVHTAGHNLVGKTSGCNYLAGPGDQLNKNPMLGALQSNGGPTKTMALLAGSLAIDAILKTACPFHVDQRGVKRPQGPRCDIGAYERTP